MAITKICGIETEYAILHRGIAEPNPITASSLLINAYLHETLAAGTPGPAPRVSWDFEDEMPSNDARGYFPIGAMPPEVETHLVNAVLTNGARYYVDHAHPEMSTPECADARSVVVFDRAGEEIVRQSMAAAKKLLPEGEELVVYKNNSDGKGNTYGCHENYLMDRTTPFGQIVLHATAHFVTRQIFTGGREGGVRGDRHAPQCHRLPDHPAGRLFRRRGRPGDHAQATHHQHQGRTPRRRPALPTPARDLR